MYLPHEGELSVQELVLYARANPGKLSNASQGNAASGHLVGEQFKQLAGIQMVHVPYRGAAPAIQDLIAGHVQVMFDSVSLQAPLIKGGMAYFNCRVLDSMPVGENTLFVAEVLAARGEGEGDPLVYHNRLYWNLSSLQPAL